MILTSGHFYLGRINRIKLLMTTRDSGSHLVVTCFFQKDQTTNTMVTNPKRERYLSIKLTLKTKLLHQKRIHFKQNKRPESPTLHKIKMLILHVLASRVNYRYLIRTYFKVLVGIKRETKQSSCQNLSICLINNTPPQLATILQPRNS